MYKFLYIMSKIMQFVEKNEKLIFFILLMLYCLTLFSTYLFTTIPYSQGWGNYYADLVFSGKFPYRDFYYYLPPYNLILDCLLWMASFGHLILYQIYRLIERLIMIGLVYNLLCKITKPRYACIGTCVGTAMFVAIVYDLIGDYNQTCLLFTVILTALYFKYIENFNSKNITKQYVLLFFSGIIIGLSFLLKQPLFVAECLIFFPLLTASFIMNKKEGYFKSLGISLIGIIIPIGIASFILAINGAFIPFINQVYLGASGKGSIFNILFVLFRACIKYKYILLSIAILLFLFFKSKNTKDANEKKLNIILLLLIAVIFLVAFT